MTREHITDGKPCWCGPEAKREGDAIIWVHRQIPACPNCSKIECSKHGKIPGGCAICLQQSDAALDAAEARVLVEKSRAEKAESALQEAKAELSDAVPRSRYNVACDQYNDAEAARKQLFGKAQELLIRAEKAEAALAESSAKVVLLDKLLREWEENPDHAEAIKALSDRDKTIARLQERIDRTITAALRYESRHDMDQERGKLWGELKMALMVDAPEFLATQAALDNPATGEKP